MPVINQIKHSSVHRKPFAGGNTRGTVDKSLGGKQNSPNAKEQMSPTVEQQRQSRQNEQRHDRGFEHLAAPALHRGLEMATFSPELAAFKLLFKLAPDICTGMSLSNGENLPNRQNVFVMSAIDGLKDLITRGGPSLRAA